MQAWHTFLQDSQLHEHPANIIDGTVIDYGHPEDERSALLDKTIICDLSHLGLLEVQGADALSFLQGQLTNDIKQLNGNNAQYTAYCNPKGRMLAFFLAFSHHDHIHLQLPLVLAESIAKRLKMFVMRSKVSISDMRESIIKIGINGPASQTLLSALFEQIPTEDYALVSVANATLLKLPSKSARFEIFTTMTHAPHIWQTLAKSATPVGAEGWEWLEIQSGIPCINTETQEAFVPQMLNLDALNAINYKKGCYTGQEIVARTHYLGKVKRRMQLASINSEASPKLGDEVLDKATQVVGKIVRVAKSPNQTLAGHGIRYDLLVECRLESIESEDQPENEKPALFWQSQPITISALPYSVAD